MDKMTQMGVEEYDMRGNKDLKRLIPIYRMLGGPCLSRR
jgi:hypothetical protein